MSKHVVELMGGVLGVESCVGLGSVFWFEMNSAPMTSTTPVLALVHARGKRETLFAFACVRARVFVGFCVFVYLCICVFMHVMCVHFCIDVCMFCTTHKALSSVCY